MIVGNWRASCNHAYLTVKPSVGEPEYETDIFHLSFHAKDVYPVYITPSPPHFTQVTASEWPLRQITHFLNEMSHMRASPSLLELTKRRQGEFRCSGSQDTPVIHFLWP